MSNVVPELPAALRPAENMFFSMMRATPMDVPDEAQQRVRTLQVRGTVRHNAVRRHPGGQG